MRGHEVIKVQATLHIEIYQARYVDRKMVRAHVRTLKPAFTEQGEALKFDLDSHGHHAGDRRDSARAEHGESRFDGGFETDRFYGMIDAASGHLQYLMDQVFACLNDIGSAEAPRQFELGGGAVNRDDPASTRQKSTIDRRQSYAPTTDDRNSLAGPDPCRVDGGANPRQHRTSQHGCLVEGHVA